jgi:MFS family permease
VSFVVSAFLQVVRGYGPVGTGVIFTAATVGLLISSIAAERLAKRYPQRALILAGFVGTLVGIGILLALVSGRPSAWAFAPGLLVIGLGIGAMLTPSVNVVQSSFDEQRQGEISGLSRSVSNLGSSLGAAIAGTILVAGLTSDPKRSYALAMVVLAVIGVVGLVASWFLPTDITPATAPREPHGKPSPWPGDSPTGRFSGSVKGVQAEGQSEASGGEEPHEPALVLEGLGHHRVRQHRQDGATGEGEHEGDRAGGCAVEEGVAEECRDGRDEGDDGPQQEDA